MLIIFIKLIEFFHLYFEMTLIINIKINLQNK